MKLFSSFGGSFNWPSQFFSFRVPNFENCALVHASCFATGQGADRNAYFLRCELSSPFYSVMSSVGNITGDSGGITAVAGTSLLFSTWRQFDGLVPLSTAYDFEIWITGFVFDGAVPPVASSYNVLLGFETWSGGNADNFISEGYNPEEFDFQTRIFKR